MKRMLIFLAAASLLGTAPIIVAQMRGGGGMGQSRPSGGMQGSSSQQGMGSMGQSGQMANRDQRRQTMHTTQQQDKKYASCVQAMNKVRTGIKHMSGTTAGQTFDAQQADDGSGQLDTDVQDLEQDQNEFPG